VIARAIAAVVVKMMPAISSIRMGIGLRGRGKGSSKVLSLNSTMNCAALADELSLPPSHGSCSARALTRVAEPAEYLRDCAHDRSRSPSARRSFRPSHHSSDTVRARSREELTMSDDLKRLIERAKQVQFTAADAELQRRSFAYGNTRFENERITKAMVDREAEALRAKGSRG
jgi:hypothetical protein